MVYDLEVAFNGDEHQVDFGRQNATPEDVLAENPQAKVVAERADEPNAGELGSIGGDEHHAAEQVQHVLVEYHQLFAVLLGLDHRVHDDSVGCRADDPDEHDRRLEIVGDTT